MSEARKMRMQRIMGKAWSLAREGAKRFGGSARLYFACALRLAWKEAAEKPMSGWRPGLGARYVLPGLGMPQGPDRKGQILLMGIWE